MTEERIITAATITTGEKNDGKELQTLVEKSIQSGVKVDTIIGDTAYSEKGNIKYSNENNIKLVAKLNPSVTQGFRKKEDEFEFNKDAGMYVCKEGHMAIRKARQGKKGISTNQVHTYYFDVIDCQYKCNTLYLCCIKYLCRCFISETLAGSIIYYSNNMVKLLLTYRRKIKLFGIKLS